MKRLRSRTVRAGAVALLWALALGCVSAGPALAEGQPAAAPPSTLDGPSSDLPSPAGLGLSIARDGTGAAVYLKQSGGVPHVFVSPLLGGVFQPPIQVDDELPGPSSQPVIAATNGGLVLVAFVNGGELFVADHLAGAGSFSAPIPLASGATNPAISISTYGKAYLAFAVADGNGEDVRAAYFWQGRWALESAPLNATPGDSAGTGSGRPAVVAAGDGIGIVAWGEAGGVYTRRVWGTSPSVAVERADGPLPACTELSADEPVVGAGGDSSFAAVAFHEQLSCGGNMSSRVLMNRLRGSEYDGITQPDGLTAGGDNAEDPQLAVGEYGSGLVTSERSSTNALIATDLGANEVPGATAQVNAGPEAGAPSGVPAMAGLYTRLVAWQQDPGSAGLPEIRVRYAPGQGPLGPEMVVSSPIQGFTDAAAGLAAAGDKTGDAAVVWVQGNGTSNEIMAAQLYQPPGSFSLVKRRKYVRTSRPRLSWTMPQQAWGPIRFAVTVDGAPAITTYATTGRPKSALSDGPHSYQVTASNPAGQQSQTGVGRVFVDTTPPVAGVRLRHAAPVGALVRAVLSYADLPPSGSPAADASGVASVTLRWGDGTVTKIHRGSRQAAHVYARPGRYLVTIVVSDRAGNISRATARITITRPKPRTGRVRSPARPH